MTTTTRPITAEELLAMGDIGRCELIRGEIHRMSPAGFQHGTIAQTLAHLLSAHVNPNRLGKVTAAETGFTLRRSPDTVRAPDVGFVSSSRIPPEPISGYFPGAPDLAVEVVSPNDTATEVEEKVAEWLSAGTTSVWVVYPTSKSVTVYRSGNQITRYTGDSAIIDEPTLPGLRLDLKAVFAQ